MSDEKDRAKEALDQMWKEWCRQAADKANISIEELKRRLQEDEAELEIHVVFKKDEVLRLMP